MRATVQNNVSATDYLKMDMHSDVKHEFIYRNVIEMPGTTILHGRVVKRFCNAIAATLPKNGFEVFTTGLKVEVTKNDVFFYSDVVVTKEEVQGKNSSFIQQPILLAEVLFPSTRTYDNVDKFIQYKNLESLQYYLLIDTEKQLVIFYKRTINDEWLSVFYTQLYEIIDLPLLSISISLKDIYPA